MAEEVKATDEKQEEEQDGKLMRQPNAQFICPITKKLMISPVFCAGDGETYEEEALKTWLETKNTSPVTQKELSSKKYVKNWGLKYIIEDWTRAGISRAVDGTRLQALFETNGEFADLFDVEFLVGANQFKFGAVRVMVGTLCQYFNNLLLSDGGKSQNVFELPNITPVAFNQILHLAYNMEPEIDPDNVIEVLQAANLCGLAILKDECLENLRKNISIPKVADKFMAILENPEEFGLDSSIREQYIGIVLNSTVDADSAITVFNTAFALRELTPKLEEEICNVFNTQGEAVVKSSAFLLCRPELMMELLQSSYFEVNEELLWSRVVAWAGSQAELEGTDPDDPDLRRIIAKKSKQAWGGIFSDEAKIPMGFPPGAHKHLAKVIPYMRFPLMDVEFFCENAAPLLGRETADTVMFHHLANRPCAFKAVPRRQLGSDAAYTVVAAHPNLEAAKNIPDPDVQAKWAYSGLGSADNNKQWFVIDCGDSVEFKSFEWKNLWDDEETIKDVELSLLPLNVVYSEDVAKVDDGWFKFQDIVIAKSTSWQELEVQQPPQHPRARYFKFVVTSTYGTESSRTALDFLKIKVENEWRTNFANKLDEVES